MLSNGLGILVALVCMRLGVSFFICLATSKYGINGVVEQNLKMELVIILSVKHCNYVQDSLK